MWRRQKDRKLLASDDANSISEWQCNNINSIVVDHKLIEVPDCFSHFVLYRPWLIGSALQIVVQELVKPAVSYKKGIDL